MTDNSYIKIEIDRKMNSIQVDVHATKAEYMTMIAQLLADRADTEDQLIENIVDVFELACELREMDGVRLSFGKPVV